jgi:hypothetical protein
MATDKEMGQMLKDFGSQVLKSINVQLEMKKSAKENDPVLIAKHEKETAKAIKIRNKLEKAYKEDSKKKK